MFQKSQIASIALAAFATLPLGNLAWSQQSTPSPTVRVRGTVVFADAQKLIVKDRSGEVVDLARAPNMNVSEVYPIKLTDIKKGSFVGAGAMPQPDGSQKAMEVVVFPEAARGTGEGHYAWDFQPDSTMTNATVTDLAAAPASVRGGKQLRLQYKGGEKIVTVPSGVPVVTFRPGSESLLVPGARVVVTAQERSGTPTALRVLAGRNGFTPPM